MRLWLQIILEWLNCLDILETNIKDLTELEDGKFYKKLIELLSWKGAKEISNTKSVVRNFLQDEYPDFMFDDELVGEVDHIYIASVFLLHTSQEALFQQPMCNKLQHETQVKIKTFLEMIIPYGKNITRETLKTVIAELGEDVPKTPGMPNLKEFFNSPAARSAQSYKLLSSKYRELRKLKTELEVERFEKADLQEDLKIQQNKVQSLQKRLQDKGAEIKALRDERMRQNTPQSCKKSKRTADYERQYRREMDRLEDRLLQKQCEVDKLETDNDTLSKRVTCAEKQCVYFREKLVNFERTIENLQIQGEIKDRELLNLRAANDELRMHLNELNKIGVEEQSFEIDGVLPLNSSISHFNNSEVLSSVIEIQLQEAKEESASLKTQLDILKKKLDSTTQEYEHVTEQLREKTLISKTIENKLNAALNKLTQEVEALQEEKTSVINKNRDLEDLSDSQEKSLSQLEEANSILNTKVVTLKEKVKSTEESLHKETENNIKLNTALYKLTQDVETLQEEKTSVINTNRDLEALSDSQEKSLSQLEEANSILNTEVVALKEKVKSTEESLHKETENNIKLNTALYKLTQDVETLQEEKTSVINKNRDLEALSDSQKKSLSQLEEAKSILNTQVVALKEKVKSTEESLHKETENNIKLNTALYKLTQDVETLQEEKTSVINTNRDLEALSDSQEKSLLRLEEAKNILNTEVVALKEKVKSTEESLHEETENNIKLNTALYKLTQDVETLQEEKTSVINTNRDLEALSDSQEKSLLQLEEAKNILNTEVVALKEKVKSTEESLQKETENNVKLNAALTETKLELQENVKCIQDLTRQNNLHKTNIENCNQNLKKIMLHHSEANDIRNNNLDDATTIELVECLRILLFNSDERSVSKQMKIESLNNVMEEMKLQEQDYQLQISTLEGMHKQNIVDISKLKETIALNVTNINELTTTIHQCSKEISYLKQIEIEKQALEKDLNVLKAEMNEKDLLLNSSKVSIKLLEDNLRALVAEFHLTKKDVLNQLNECQKQTEETVTTAVNDYEILYNNFSKELLYKKTVEDKLADNKKRLMDSEYLITMLENNLRKNEQTIRDLERTLINTEEKLVESVQKLENLEEANGTLEKHHKSLKSQNEKILLDLNIINDKLKLSQEETYNMSDQLKFNDDKIECLIEELSSLKSEKEEMIHVLMEKELKLKRYIKELETKISEEKHRCDQLNTEAKFKQETLQIVQSKFENLSKEATVSEMKMKELITNLQEVRTNQGAVLTTQEKALKEKDLQIQQLRIEFVELKGALCKQLEDEKLLSQNLQSTNSELQLQSYKQMKTIEELQEILKRERTELDKLKAYCKAEDSKKLEISLICKELEHSVNSLKLTITGACPQNKNFYADARNPICTSKDDESGNILNIIKSSINEMHASRELILHLSNINANLNETLRDQKAVVDNYGAKCEEIKSLNNEVQELKNAGKKHKEHLNNLIKHKESLRDYVQNIKRSREGLDVLLSEVKQKWDRLLTKSHYTFTMDKSVCDELKHIQAKKIHLESTLSQYNIHHLQNMKALQTILWQKFLWTEEILKDTYLNTTNAQQSSGISLDDFSDARTLIEEELQKNTTLKQDIILSQNEIDKFSSLVASFESNFNREETKFQSEAEKKLQLLVAELTEEKNNLGSKLDCTRLQNAKLEGHIDELRNKIKELEAASLKEAEGLKKEILQSKEEITKLQEEKDELNKRPKKEDVDKQLREIHDRYKIKYDEIKQNMKTAYNEQITKLNREQEQCVQERMESLQRRMELQCRKQADELSKYKSHVADMSSQIWNVGEKLLSEQQEKEKLRKDLTELKAKYQNLEQQTVDCVEHKTSKFETRHLLPGENDKVLHKVAVIQEKTTYERRCSIRSIQTMGNAFNAEDEEGEVFDNTYLADMKNGHCSLRLEPDRVSILQQRNALCKPHLKSSYPAEMQFHPLSLTEEEIKLGSVPDDVFNDSLSQSLLPEQKTKKRDRTQTSYKKPGPPTPSKNGGRLSLQGNELKSPSSRILRERNKDRGTSTPRTLKSLFSSKRHDENTAITPRGRRRSSIFRKHRVNDR